MPEAKELQEMLLPKDGSDRATTIDAKWLRYFLH